MNSIELHGLTKTYTRKGKEKVRAVDNLSLSIPEGKIFGILGPNGAGKTTTIKMICGLVHPDEGEISISGHDLRKNHSKTMSQIGAVLEGTRNIYWRLSPWENLMYFARLKGMFGRDAAERAEALLTELGLWDRRRDPVRTFSRGMQQKVAIACALVADPEVVLLDEPTLGLDVQAARTVRKWVAELSHDQGKTIVLTTHQLPVAQELCDQIAIIREGKLIANEPTEKLLTLFEDEYYEIRLKGELPKSVTIDGFALRRENGESILTGLVHDGLDLYSTIDTIRATGLPLISVSPSGADLEGIFIKLMEQS